MEQRWNEGAAKARLGNIGRILTGGREDLPPHERDETAKGSAAKAASVSIAPAAAAEEDDDQDDDPQTIAAPTIITTHKIASSKVRMFGSTRKHRASFHPMSLPQKGARQKEKRPTAAETVGRFYALVISPAWGWR